MKKLLIYIVLIAILVPSIASAQLTVPQGGTGKTSFPQNSWIYSDNGTLQRLQASSTPTVQAVYATSTTATSYFGGLMRIVGNLFLPSLSQGVAFIGSGGVVSTVATTTADCSGTVSCSQFTVIGPSPITITGSGAVNALGTTTPWTVGQIAYVVNNSTLTSIATGTISVPTGLTATANRYVVGGNFTLGLDTGYVIPLQSTLDAKLVSLGSGYATTTQNTITFSTSTTAFNGLTFGQTIIPTAGALTFKPTITGTLDNAGLTNSTISGIALGSNLANLSATDSSLTFSGTYTGAVARTIGLNVGNSNAWTALQTFLNASSTLFSARQAYFGGSATTTIGLDGSITMPSGSTFTKTGVSDGCANWSSGVLGTTGVACGSGGSSISQWATTTAPNALGIYPAGAGYVLMGTSTHTNLPHLTVASSTAPQLSLSNGAGFSQWTFRNVGNNLYFSTTTIAGTATTSTSALSLFGDSGRAVFGPSTNTQFQYVFEGGSTASVALFNSSASAGFMRFIGGNQARLQFGGTLNSTVAFFDGTAIAGQQQAEIGTNVLAAPIIFSVGGSERGRFASTSNFMVGTTTSTGFYNIISATSTAPQLNLSEGAGQSQWTFRGIGGKFYIATTTVDGTATSSVAAFAIDNNGGVTIPALPTGLTLSTSGALSAYAGTSCTNQFIRSLSGSGAATCATVSSGDVSLANLTATDATLTFSGTYNGSTARTIGLNLGNANIWTALQSHAANASTTGLSAGYAYFGTTATSSFSNIGALRVATSTSFLNSILTSVGTTTIHGNFATKMASTTAGTSMTGLLIDWSGTTNASNGSNTYRITLTGNATIVLNATSSNPIDGGRYVVKLCQDATGSRTVTWTTPGEIRWAAGTTTVSSTANTATQIGFIYDALDQRYTAVASTTGTQCKP